MPAGKSLNDLRYEYYATALGIPLSSAMNQSVSDLEYKALEVGALSGGGGGITFVTTTDSPSVDFSGAGTAASPLTATAVGAVSSVDSRTGAVTLNDRYLNLTETSPKTFANSPYTAAPNEYVLWDNTGGNCTQVLPAAPAPNTLVGAKISTLGGTNFVSVNCSGSDVFYRPGGPTTQAGLLVTGQQGVVFHYNSGIWHNIATSMTTGAMDARYLVASTTPTLQAGTDLEILPPVANVSTIQTTTGAHSFAFPLFARATADQIQNNVNTVQNDTSLVVNVLANATYVMNGMIFIDAGLTADFRSGWSTTATGSTMDWTINFGENTGTANAVLWLGVLAIGATQQVGGRGVGTPSHIQLNGVLVTSTTPGVLQYKWSQGALVVEDTTRKAGSWLMLQRVA